MRNIIAVVMISLLVMSCASSGNTEKTETRKPTPGDVERIDPLRYLDMKSDYVISNNNRIFIDGQITNYASVAIYRNVTIQVFCLDGKGEIKKREKLVALDMIAPGGRPFKVSAIAAAGTRKVVIKLFEASGVK